MEKSRKWILIIRMSEYEKDRRYIIDHLSKCSFYHLGNDVFVSDTADATITYSCAFYLNKKYNSFIYSIIPVYGEISSDVIDTKGV